MTAHLEPAACGHDNPQRLFSAPFRPRLLTLSLPSQPWMIFSLSHVRVCGTDVGRVSNIYVYRPGQLWSAEILLIIGTNCRNSFISSTDSARGMFAVVSNHIDPQREVCALRESFVVVSLNYYDEWVETKEILLKWASWTAIYHLREEREP